MSDSVFATLHHRDHIIFVEMPKSDYEHLVRHAVVRYAELSGEITEERARVAITVAITEKPYDES